MADLVIERRGRDHDPGSERHQDEQREVERRDADREHHGRDDVEQRDARAGGHVAPALPERDEDDRQRQQRDGQQPGP